MNNQTVNQLLLSAAKKGQAMADFIYSLDKKAPGHPQQAGKKSTAENGCHLSPEESQVTSETLAAWCRPRRPAAGIGSEA